jgi:hypothetical protein
VQIGLLMLLLVLLLLLLCSTNSFLHGVTSHRTAALLRASKRDSQGSYVTMLDLVQEEAAIGDEDLVHVFAALEVSCCFLI